MEPHAAVPVTHQNDVTWFDSATFPVGDNTKLNADGKGGWLAHVADGVLFLKTFEDLPVSSQVPGEGEVEIYADGAGSSSGGTKRARRGAALDSGRMG